MQIVRYSCGHILALHPYFLTSMASVLLPVKSLSTAIPTWTDDFAKVAPLMS